jgi:flagellar motor switch protein FliG
MLTEEIEELGAVRMKDVEDSQQIVIRIIQDLEAKGEIVIGGRGGEEFIE